jgi:hypothetical protein
MLIALVGAALIVAGWIHSYGFRAPSRIISIGLSILVLGWGFYPALRSVASDLVSEAQIDQLNTTVAFM